MPTSNNPYDLIDALEHRYNELVSGSAIEGSKSMPRKFRVDASKKVEASGAKGTVSTVAFPRNMTFLSIIRPDYSKVWEGDAYDIDDIPEEYRSLKVIDKYRAGDPDDPDFGESFTIIVDQTSTDVTSATKVQARRYSSAFDGLDDRFSFDLDDEFEIYLDTLAKYVPCFVTESEVFGDGSGMRYTVSVAVPNDDAHWQIADDIERNLDRYIKEQVDGSDYTGWVDDYNGELYDCGIYNFDSKDTILDDCKMYVYDICVVPYQNISPYGDFGIDAGL